MPTELENLAQVIKPLMIGRWRGRLAQHVPIELLDGKGHPCPKCGGSDRFFAFKDFETTGGVGCRRCFNENNSDGIAALAWITNSKNGDVIKSLASELGIRKSNDNRDIISEVCADKRMPIEAFRKLNPKPFNRGDQFVARVPVYDAKGESCGTFDLWPGDKGKFSKNSKWGLFLPHDENGKPILPVPGDTILLVEGCKDQSALIGLGYNAIGLPTSYLDCKFVEAFKGVDIILVPDLDTAGQAGAKKSQANLAGIASSIRVAKLGKESNGDDVRDILAKPNGIEMVHKAIEWAKVETDSDLIQPMSAKDMFDEHPTLRPVLIDGILRRGETANIIASPKVGKSFLAGNLAWAVASGGSWLSHDVVRGSVLIIDNELHPPTLAHRIERIRMSMMLRFEDCEQVDLISLRGKSVDIHGLGSRLDIQEGKYSLVVIDALYRMLPAETSENDNAAMMAIYNRLDEYAAKWDAAIAVVHHASKGMQGDKSVTDVGSGAGAISRAADTHIVLRPHENEKLIVMEAATRSFKGMEPTSATFEYPLWHAVGGVTAVVKRQRGTDAQTKKEYEEDKADILSRLSSGKVQQKDIKNLYGGNDRFNRLIGALIKENKVRRLEVVPDGKMKEQVWYELVPE